MRLTEEQRGLVEDNHNLIYHVLKQNGLSIDEYYDVAAIGLCKAAATFVDGKSKFSTYACTCILNETKMQMRKPRAAMRTAAVISLDEEIPGTDGCTYADILPDPDCMESYAVEQVMQERIRAMKPKQRRAVELSMQGLNQCKIANAMGITHSYVNHLLKRARQELTELI